MTTHPKRPRDPNQLAKSIIDIATGETEAVGQIAASLRCLFRSKKSLDAHTIEGRGKAASVGGLLSYIVLVSLIHQV
jgi:hypothetical protein